MDRSGQSTSNYNWDILYADIAVYCANSSIVAIQDSTILDRKINIFTRNTSI